MGRVSRASPTPDHETRPARRSPAQRSPPLPRPSLVAPALGSRPSKPLKSGEKLGSRPRPIPECEHRHDWVAVGAVSSEPVSHVDKRIKDEYWMGPYYVPLQTP